MAFNIHTLFERQNLTYFLGFGSAVGAIRHEGAIPWDDDIDIIITDIEEATIFNKITKDKWDEDNIEVIKGPLNGVWDYKLFRSKSDSGMFPSCDVFVITLDEIKQKYIFRNSNLRKTRHHVFDISQVMHPVLTKFGNFYMRILSPSAYEYLTNEKGKYWRNIGFTKHYDHSFNQHMIPMAFEIPNSLKRINL